MYSQVEEEATPRTGDPITREDVEEREEDTKKSSDEDNALVEDKDTAVESVTSLDTPNNDNFTYNFKPEMGVELNYMNPVTTGVTSIISPDNNLGKITNAPKLGNNEGITNSNARDITENNLDGTMTAANEKVSKDIAKELNSKNASNNKNEEITNTMGKSLNIQTDSDIVATEVTKGSTTVEHTKSKGIKEKTNTKKETKKGNKHKQK